jgi:hypothetical protein
MKKIVFFILMMMVMFAFASDMIIHKTDGSNETIAIEEIENITFVSEQQEPPERILFIGNSYTYYNGGIGTHLQEFALTADPFTPIYIESITAGGATIQSHYNNPTTVQTILDGNWDIVVLQEQSTRPVEETNLFYEYATLMDDVISNAGAETAFFMTWAREYDPGMIEGLANAYNTIGEQLGAIVVPVGRAFQNSLTQDPELILHVADGSHPSIFGTYLAVCTFYGKLWNATPFGIEYVSDGLITNEEREFLQTIAWDTIIQEN